jgi:hypothetical protein
MGANLDVPPHGRVSASWCAMAMVRKMRARLAPQGKTGSILFAAVSSTSALLTAAFLFHSAQTTSFR